VEQLEETLPKQLSTMELVKETVTYYMPVLRVQKPPSNPVDTPAEKPTESAGRRGGDVKEDAKGEHQRPAETAPSQLKGAATSTKITPPAIVPGLPINQPGVPEDEFEGTRPSACHIRWPDVVLLTHDPTERACLPPVAENASKGSGEPQRAGMLPNYPCFSNIQKLKPQVRKIPSTKLREPLRNPTNFSRKVCRLLVRPK
jgi:hypothetical protein